jgi:hypothetical protein
MNNVAILSMALMFVGIPLLLLLIHLIIKAIQSKSSLVLSALISKYNIFVVIFVLSLITPAYKYDYYGTLHYSFGIEAFLLGPIGLFAGHFSWLANVFLLLAVLTQKNKPNLSNCMFIISLAVACTFLLGKTIAVGSAGDFEYHVHVGFYLWLLSILSAFFGSLTKRRIEP